MSEINSKIIKILIFFIEIFCFAVIMKFANAEYADFIFFYGKANGNATEAKRLYAEAFPNRRVSHKTIFQSTYTRACDLSTNWLARLNY